MRKKITKIIENALPQMFNQDGEVISRRIVANKIIDIIPNIEKLELLPFQKWIPVACSACFYGDVYRLGCTYGLYDEYKHAENLVPPDCPLGYS